MFRKNDITNYNLTLLWLMIVYIALLAFAVDLIIIILINSIIVLNTIVRVTGISLMIVLSSIISIHDVVVADNSN